MRIVAVAEGVVKRHLHRSTIHLQGHGVRGYGYHPGRLGPLDAAVMAGIGQHRFGVVVVHVFADPIADCRREGVGGHGEGGRSWGDSALSRRQSVATATGPGESH